MTAISVKPSQEKENRQIIAIAVAAVDLVVAVSPVLAARIVAAVGNFKQIIIRNEKGRIPCLFLEIN